MNDNRSLTTASGPMRLSLICALALVSMGCNDGPDDPEAVGTEEGEDSQETGSTDNLDCGNGIVDADEECDDGNAADDDSCTSECIERKIISVVSGGHHHCVLLSTHAVRCWGDGETGALGYGNVEDIGDNEHPASAGDVDVGGAVVQLVAGFHHTCALLDTGAVRCWGTSSSGQVGIPGVDIIGDDEPPASTAEVEVGGTVVKLAAGYYHTCALLDTANLRCWGKGYYGQLGYGNTEDIGDDEHPAIAGDVGVGAPVRDVAAGSSHTCALLEDGNVRCWGAGALGYGNDFAHIGNDELPGTAGNVDIGGKATRIAVGDWRTCVVLESKDVRCWGNGDYGSLGHPGIDYIGDDELPGEVDPVEVGGPVVDVKTGSSHTCALLESGAVRCWGFSYKGQLGYGNPQHIGDDEIPAAAGDVPLDGTVDQISLAPDRSCALLTKGSLRCWGNNTRGELGLGYIYMETAMVGDDELPTDVAPIQVL